jgi:hypothetical protein
MSVVTAILAFLTSEQGLWLTGVVVTWLWARTGSKSKRAQKVAAIGAEAFAVVEGMKRAGIPLKGAEAWLRFVEVVIDSMQAQGLGRPTAQEMGAFKVIASNKSWIAKDGKPSPVVVEP